MSIRERIIRDNGIILGNSKGFGIPIELISPSAIEYTGIYGRVVYSDVSNDSDGIDYIVNDPVITININQLERVPKTGEKWIVKIPESIGSETMISCTFERPVERNDSIGFILLRLVKIDQSEEE